MSLGQFYINSEYSSTPCWS